LEIEHNLLTGQSLIIRLKLFWEEEISWGVNPTSIKNLNCSSAGDNKHKVPLVDKMSPFVNQTRILPLACSSHYVFLFVFFLFEIPNFCMNRSFEFSVHREYNHFCLRPPFRVFGLTGFIPFLVSLIFVWTALSGFQSTGTLSIA
jgi:hypothetical protein